MGRWGGWKKGGEGEEDRLREGGRWSERGRERRRGERGRERKGGHSFIFTHTVT